MAFLSSFVVEEVTVYACFVCAFCFTVQPPMLVKISIKANKLSVHFILIFLFPHNTFTFIYLRKNFPATIFLDIDIIKHAHFFDSWYAILIF